MEEEAYLIVRVPADWRSKRSKGSVNVCLMIEHIGQEIFDHLRTLVLKEKHLLIVCKLLTL